jgi:GMP synthase-like glutamine amidotransferase
VDVVVAMGAPWSVYDDATIGSWIGREIAFVRDVHERGIPYLGVCFGGQVLAAALGGQVERAPRSELGWCLVGTTAAPAVADGPWFHWHSDRFTLPPGADALAANEVGVQAFRVGRSVGVQFHPEVDADLMASWLLDGGPPDPLFAELGVEVADIMTTTSSLAAVSMQNAHRLVDWFLSLEPAR